MSPSPVHGRRHRLIAFHLENAGNMWCVRVTEKNLDTGVVHMRGEPTGLLGRRFRSYTATIEAIRWLLSAAGVTSSDETWPADSLQYLSLTPVSKHVDPLRTAPPLPLSPFLRDPKKPEEPVPRPETEESSTAPSSEYRPRTIRVFQ